MSPYRENIRIIRRKNFANYCRYRIRLIVPRKTGIRGYNRDRSRVSEGTMETLGVEAGVVVEGDSEGDSEEAEGVAEEEGPGEVIWSLIIMNTGKRPKSLLRSYEVHVCMYSFFPSNFCCADESPNFVPF